MSSLVSSFKLRFFEFAYGLVTFYSRYKLSFTVYLSIPALITGFHKILQPLYSEAVVQRCSVKNVFWEISQNSQENTCARVSFLIKLQACNLIKKETVAQVFSFEFWEISKNTFFQGTPLVAAYELYLPIKLDVDIRGWSSYSLREVITIQRIINLGSLNSLVNSKWGSFCTSK